MAESVKILSPETEVILPVPSATCLMAEQISPERVREFKKNNPDTAVVAYINTTAALKAECDVCVTSSSALKIVKALPNKDILFIPDKNLGSYVKKQIPEKNIILTPEEEKLFKLRLQVILLTVTKSVLQRVWLMKFITMVTLQREWKLVQLLQQLHKKTFAENVLLQKT